MQFSFDISSNATPEKKADAPVASGEPVTMPAMVLGLMQQMLDSQRQAHQEMIALLREQLNHARALRWEKVYPELPDHARKIYPVMEKTYLEMLNRLATDLAEEGEEAFDNEFALQDFLDRNGPKIGQFAHLLSIIGPISEVGNLIAAQNESQS